MGTNYQIVTCQENTMDPDLRRGDGVVCLDATIYKHCATMGWGNFKDPIPAFAHPRNLTIPRGPEQE